MFLRLIVYFGATTAALAGIYYQIVLKEMLIHGGYWRTTIPGLNNGQCFKVPELQACEKMVLHSKSNTLFLACSTPLGRTFWDPTMDRFNATGRSLEDHIATYSLVTGKISRLKLKGFPSDEPLALHGFDVVTSDADSSELLFYLVNHRPHRDAGNPENIGVNSVIEMFKMSMGSGELEYVKTFEDPSVIIMPNGVFGHGDGSFYFTNNHRSEKGILKVLGHYIRRRDTSIGYCHVETGCKVVSQPFNGAKGIARGPDDLYFVASHNAAELYVLERQTDNSLVLTDILKSDIDMPMGNISVDENGDLFIAAFLNRLQFVAKSLPNPSVKSASAVVRLSRNSGAGQFYGEKFKLEKIFQDDGNIANGGTTTAWFAKDKTLYLSGVNSLHMTVCRIDELVQKVK